MDNALNALFSWQFLLFSIGIFTITWLVRTIVEYFIPKAIGSKLWEKLILPIAPTLLGVIVAYFASKYAYPDGLNSVSGRLFFGLTAGNFSSSAYQVAKGMLKDKIQSFSPNAASTAEAPSDKSIDNTKI